MASPLHHNHGKSTAWPDHSSCLLLQDMVLTAADGEVVVRIVPDMTSGKLLLRTSGDGGR
jgi:hypothetical protein